MSEEYPTFQLGRSRFDQSTFYGRLRHFLNVTDPRMLFTSKASLDKACLLLDQYKNGTLPNGITNKELWEAQKVKQDTYRSVLQMVVGLLLPNPTFVQTIFWQWLNQSHNACVNYANRNATKVVELFLPNPTFAQTIFWQWLNQSHNACVNYANRNATKPTPTSRFIIGYIGAVTSAVGIALGLGVLIKRANSLSPAMKMLVQRFVPFPAVATASTCNVLLMRNNELTTGIEVFDKDEQVIGTSKIAAKKALQETAVTRMFLPAPILLIPPVIMTYLEKTKFLKRNPKMHLPVNAVVCTMAFGFALPVAIALFPQISKIKREQLEQEIQTKTTESVVYYNKGL